MTGHEPHDRLCEELRAQFSLLLYGELSFDEEERLDAHLEQCEACRKALEGEREFHEALERVAVEPPESLLEACRADLRARLEQEPRPEPVAAPREHWWDRLVGGLTLSPAGPGWLRPAGALALLALGFAGAQLAPRGGFGELALVAPAASRVRFVEPAGEGRVQIVLDETRQRTLTGRIDDGEIRSLLLAAAKDPADPGLRTETLSILNGRAQAADVQNALVYALRHDENAGVRLKALEGLRPYAQQSEVRAALAAALLGDDNPGVRTQAIDLLTASGGGAMDRQVIGTLQELMLRESNSYVRDRGARVLEAVNASLETY